MEKYFYLYPPQSLIVLVNRVEEQVDIKKLIRERTVRRLAQEIHGRFGYAYGNDEAIWFIAEGLVDASLDARKLIGKFTVFQLFSVISSLEDLLCSDPLFLLNGKGEEFAREKLEDLRAVEVLLEEEQSREWRHHQLLILASQQ